MNQPDLGQDMMEEPFVVIIQKDRFPAVPPRHDMIKSTWKLDPGHF